MNDMTLADSYREPHGLQIAALALAAAFVLAVALTSFLSNMLRDQSTSANKPYSLARTQMMWWTLIIGLCVILYCGARGAVPDITGTCLVLLGIGAVTTVSARIIDDRQRDDAAAKGNVPLHQDESSTNMLSDILSDGAGLSVPRFQSFVFNLIYGLSFLYSFCLSSKFPNYNAEALTLLGISSAGYVALKAFENKSPATAAGQNDELLDASVAPTQTASG